MCGRYGRRGDKQKIAEAFHVTAGLDEVEFTESLDCAPGSIQPVVSVSDDGERQLSLMRWGFKLPDRLLFNVRAEGVETAKFWKEKLGEWLSESERPPSHLMRITPGRTDDHDAGVQWQSRSAEIPTTGDAKPLRLTH